MPAELPLATEDQRALAASEKGYDTEVARFFGAIPVRDEDVPTQIESAELGRQARDRALKRAQEKPARLR
jgi:hypothetical protein